MRKTFAPLLTLILLALTCNTSAQNLGRIIRKTVVEPSRTANDIAQDKAEEEAERRATKAIMEGFGISEDVQWDAQYEFDAWFEMTITEYSKKGNAEDPVKYDNYINRNSGDYGMEFMEDDTRSTIIFDADKYAMLILTQDAGERTGFATILDPETVAETLEDEGLEAGDLNPVKTGNTKKILGYNCDEYLIEDEQSEVHMWISEELGKELSKEMLGNSNAFGGSFRYAGVVDGMILEYDVIDTQSGEKTEMLVTDLDLKKAGSLSTEGFQILTMDLQGRDED